MNNKLQKNTLWLDLLNSDWHDYKGKGKHEDRLDKKEWYNGFIRRWLDVDPDDAHESLRDLRRLLRGITDDFAQRNPLKKIDLDELNNIMSKSPVTKKIIAVDQSYISMQEINFSGIYSMFADITSSFAEIIATGESERIKVCQNQDCLWIFYDNSKNHSRKWCENTTGCSNMMKVRKHREKKKLKEIEINLLPKETLRNRDQNN